MVVAGVGMLILAGVSGLGALTGLLSLDAITMSHQTGLRTLASLAVAGCVLAAIGFWEE